MTDSSASTTGSATNTLPPAFSCNLSDKDAKTKFKSWLQQISMWTLTTSVDNKKWAAQVVQRLQGDALTAVINLTREQIQLIDSPDNTPIPSPAIFGKDKIPYGLALIFQTLIDRGFGDSAQEEAFRTTVDFVNFRRTQGMSMIEYTSGFMQRLHACQVKGNVKFENAVSSDLLIEFAQLQRQDQVTALASCGIGAARTPTSVASWLNSVHGTTPPLLASRVETDASSVASPVFITEHDGPGWTREELVMEATDDDGNPLLLEDGSPEIVETVLYSRSFHRPNHRGAPPSQYRPWISKRPTQTPSTFPVERITCFKCGVKGHFARNCGSKEFSAYSCVPLVASTSIFNAFNAGSTVSSSQNGTDTTCDLVLDIGCTRSVVGSSWVNRFLLRHPSARLEWKESSATFNFGGHLHHAQQTVSLPLIIGNASGTLTAHVIDEADRVYSLPFLVSLTAMQKLGMSLSLQAAPSAPSATFAGSTVALNVNSHGHLILPYRVTVHHDPSAFSVCVTSTVLDESRVRRIHRALGHPSGPKMMSFLRSSSVSVTPDVKALVEDVVNSCDPCSRTRPPTSVSSTCVPLSRGFNDVIAIDIMMYRGLCILKIICLGTRFLVAVIIPNHSALTVTKTIASVWIDGPAGFGPPRAILADREFGGTDYNNFVEAFGIEPFSTAAESPESNGICERVGLTIRTTIDRIVKDSNPMNIREALTTAVVAHNSMSNVHGYSPHQLVFGQQRRSPALQDMSQPQIDQLSSSDPTSFAARVANILTARAQFAALDADARLLRAMNAPHIRDVTGNYTIGDKVIFYSDDASKEWRGWHGPATYCRWCQHRGQVHSPCVCQPV